MTTSATAGARIVHRSLRCDDLCIEYPCSDGEPMADNSLQAIAMNDTFSTLRIRYGDDPSVYVAVDMLLYYRRGDASERVAPDVFVVFGANGNHPRHSWLIWEEGGAVPSFVLEVGSPSTWERDATEKRVIYARMGVLEYWRFDPLGYLFSPVLIGERLVNGQYQPIDTATDESGILRGHSAALELDICVRTDSEHSELHLYDPISREWLLNHREETAARQQERAARQQAEAAQQQERAARQQAEVARQQERAARQQAEVARQQAEAAHQQAEAAHQQAEAENRLLLQQLEEFRSQPRDR